MGCFGNNLIEYGYTLTYLLIEYGYTLTYLLKWVI